MSGGLHATNRGKSRLSKAGTRSGVARRSALMWNAVLLVIAGLLATIAFLQYRWIKQIDTAMEVRARSNLASLMTQWNRDFYGGLYSICGALQVGPDSGARDNWVDFLQRYSNWSNKHAQQGSVENIHLHRAMISKIYLWETSASGNPTLFLLNPDSSRIDEAAIPQPLKALLSRLQGRSQNLRAALGAWELPDSPQFTPETASQPQPPNGLRHAYEGWQLDESIPAIVHPLVHHAPALSHPETPAASADSPVDWMIIVLDFDTIQKKILPQLANRYFGGQQGLDYKVALIAAGKPPHIIYSSDLGFPERDFTTYDASMNVFGQPPEIGESQLWEFRENHALPRRDDLPSMTGPGWLWFPVIQYPSGKAPWMLVLQRRAGSIDAVANRVWRTNLVTGMAVLVLLLASVSLVVVATRRVQRLALLQMNFVTAVSHELRTPLAVMLSAAENIADGVVDKPSEIREHGRIITGQGRRLSDLVDRILMFAAGAAGENLQSRRPVQVPEIVERVLQNLAEPIRSAGIHVEQNIPSDLPRVFADPVVLCQCLQNLVVNALKYRGQSNWIGISAELQESDHSSPEIQIRVQDHGIGIRESELQRVFEPFYRSPEVLGSHVQGTGLGLAVVRRGVCEMGGRVTVSSAVDVGSTFTVCLPVAESPVIEGSVPDPARSGEPVR